MDLRDQKKTLRKSVQQRLKNMSEREVQHQSNNVSDRLFEMESLKKASGVSVYLSMAGEVVTYGIVKRLFKAGKRVYVPCITGPKHTDMMMIELSTPQVIEDWPKNKWGIPEPPPSSIPNTHSDATHNLVIDTVLCPAVAFNKDCSRLGHGKGYYDSFLNRSNSLRNDADKPPLYTIGLGLTPQLVEDKIPTNDLDVQLNAVVLPDIVMIRNSSA